MKFVYKILLCVVFVGILSGCTTSHQQTSFGEAKTNFAQENYQAAFHNIQGPANAGNAEAEYALGYMYYYGKGTPIDQEKGKEWILKSAQAGNKDAQAAYQMILAREQQVMPSHTAPKEQMPVMKAPQQQPKVTTTKSKSPVHHTTTQQHLLKNNATPYTLQLLVTSKLSDASNFIKKHQLGKDAQYFHRKLQGKDSYTVIYGHYASQKAAREEIKTLPEPVQALKPWVRSFKSVQKQIH